MACVCCRETLQCLRCFKGCTLTPNAAGSCSGRVIFCFDTHSFLITTANLRLLGACSSSLSVLCHNCCCIYTLIPFSEGVLVPGSWVCRSMEDGATVVKLEKERSGSQGEGGECEPHLTALGKGWKTVPACLPFMIPGMACGSLDEQMTIVQPAAVAILAAVSFVTIPPVPQRESAPLVSTCTAFVWQDQQLPVRSAEPAYLSQAINL